MKLRTTARLLLLALGALAPSTALVASPLSTNSQPSLILVAGSPGEPEYATNFSRQVELWTDVASRAQASTKVIGLGAAEGTNDLEQLKQAIAAESDAGPHPLWLVFIGHGTFDGKEARFNLRGPDLTATELARWLGSVQRPLVFIDTTSASAPFLNKLSGTNRVIVTATRSGNEQNFARFGQYFAKALASPESDLDKDGQTSVLEAFLSAAAGVAEFYKTEGRLATEHPLIDDNGDGLGTPADWFRGVRAIKKPQGGGSADGVRAHQAHLVLSREEQSLPPELRAKRDAVELAIARLRDTKSTRPEADYYHELEKLLVQLVEVYGSRLQ